MVVSIKDFVKTALVDIGDAVLEAQNETNIFIASGHESSPGHIVPQLIEFELVIEVSEQASGKLEGGVEVPMLSIVKASVSVDGNKKTTTGNSQRICFSVPVFFGDVGQLTRKSSGSVENRKDAAIRSEN